MEYQCYLLGTLLCELCGSALIHLDIKELIYVSSKVQFMSALKLFFILYFWKYTIVCLSL